MTFPSRTPSLCLAAFAITLVACSGGGGGFSCNLDDATTVAPTDWPSARRDTANSGRVIVDTFPEEVEARCIFPRPSAGAECSNEESAVIGVPIIGIEPGSANVAPIADSEVRILVAARDGSVHLLDADGTPIVLDREIELNQAANTPLAGADGSIFLTTENGAISRFSGVDGVQLFLAADQNDIAVAPAMGPDGVTYAGDVTGTFSAICTNRAPRFFSELGGITTLPAIVTDPRDEERTLVIVASNSGRVQALDDDRGRLRWAFFTASRLQDTAVVADEERGLFAVADTGGLVLFGSLADGGPITVDGEPFSYDAGGRIATAPALGGDHVYVLSEASAQQAPALHAVALPASGAASWTWALPADATVNASPALAVSDDGDTIVVAADFACQTGTCEGATVFAVRQGAELWSVDLPSPLGTAAPSIRSDDGGNAVVLVGTQAGQLFEIR